MKGFFDTNILIDYLAGNTKAKREIERYEYQLISIITKMELLVGADSESELKTLRNFLNTFRVVELDEKVAEEAIKLRRSLKIKLPDAIILASAKINGCQLITRNTKDLDKKDPSIRVPY